MAGRFVADEATAVMAGQAQDPGVLEMLAELMTHRPT